MRVKAQLNCSDLFIIMLQVGERFPRCHIVHHNESLSLTNPLFSRSSILLLARGVYYINIVRLAINLCRLVDSIIKCGFMSFREMAEAELGTLCQYLL